MSDFANMSKLALAIELERIEALLARIRAAAAGGGSGGNFTFAAINANNADANVTTQSTAVFFTNLTADHAAILPPAPTTGQVAVVKDADGSLAAHDIIINGNGKTIDGFATYRMTAGVDGIQGSIMLSYNGTSWSII